MERFARSVELEKRTASVYDGVGKKISDVDLDPSVFGRPANIPLIHQVVVGQLAGARAGTQSTKTRAEVSGGGAKPYKQKGTGRARQGSTRAPQFAGGGVALGPKPRSYAQKTPKKMIAQALSMTLSDRAAGGQVFVIDGFGSDVPSTKEAAAWVNALGFESTVLLVLTPDDEVMAKSFRNLSNVEVAFPSNLSAYLVLVNDAIVFTKQTLPGDSQASEGTPTALKPSKKKVEPSSEDESTPQTEESEDVVASEDDK